MVKEEKKTRTIRSMDEHASPEEKQLPLVKDS